MPGAMTGPGGAEVLVECLGYFVSPTVTDPTKREATLEMRRRRFGVTGVGVVASQGHSLLKGIPAARTVVFPT